MKFFSWMKSKIHGKDNTIKPEPAESPSHYQGKEEASSSTLLSIGTFGDMNLKTESEIKEESNEDDLRECDRELRALLKEDDDGESERFDLPLEKLLEKLPVEELMMIRDCNETEEENNGVSVCDRGNEIPSCSRKRSMYRKSISFLLKKAFLCGGGFVPTPILRNPFPDPGLSRSRMDKILKTVIRKKKQPKYLEKARTGNDEEQADSNNWVKTDSEYIFLDL